MIVVTGGAGFIGSNLVHALVARGRTDVVVVDDLTDGTKFVNLVGADIADYLDKDDFLERLRQGALQSIQAIFHQGANSTTTDWNGKAMLQQNFEYSKALLSFCQARSIPLIYASSAAVYGANATFREEPAFEAPLNVYGWSKLLFDNIVRRVLPSARSQIVGLRYFNVYGPREQHKASMASVAYHLERQLRTGDVVKLFEGSDGHAPGEQRRDFIHVADAVAVNLWFLDHPDVSGIFNTGTGRSQPFNDVARAVLRSRGRGRIVYVPFPDHLRGRYQSFTEADLARLRAAGCGNRFRPVEEGVAQYMDWLTNAAPPPRV